MCIKLNITIFPMLFFYLSMTFSTFLQANEQEQVIALVEKAKEYINTHGREKSFSEFNKASGEFSHDSSYVFAVAYDGTYLATINYPELVGTNQFDLNDPYRHLLVLEEIDNAKSGGGWGLDRMKKNPQTEKLECKASYVLPMPGDYLIGSGYYYLPNEQGDCG